LKKLKWRMYFIHTSSIKLRREKVGINLRKFNQKVKNPKKRLKQQLKLK